MATCDRCAAKTTSNTLTHSVARCSRSHDLLALLLSRCMFVRALARTLARTLARYVCLLACLLAFSLPTFVHGELPRVSTALLVRFAALQLCSFPCSLFAVFQARLSV